VINLLDRRDPHALIKYREKCREHQERLILEGIKSAPDYKQQPGSILPTGDKPMEVVKLANGSYMESQDSIGFVHPNRGMAMKMLSNHIMGNMDKGAEDYMYNKVGAFDMPNFTLPTASAAGVIKAEDGRSKIDARLVEYAKAVIVAKDHLERMNSRDMYSQTIEERAEHMVRTDMAKGALERAEREYKVTW
jgi:hypothetical protein